MSRDHFWRSISRDNNVEVSAVSQFGKIIEYREILGSIRKVVPWSSG